MTSEVLAPLTVCAGSLRHAQVMTAQRALVHPQPSDRIEEVPVITVAQMRRGDELMVESCGIGLAQMMENAGRSLAELAQSRFGPRSATILAGIGNNGGGGLVAARHLANQGVQVTVILADTVQPGTLLKAQLRAATACGAARSEEPVAGELLIDALVGYGLTGGLRGRSAELAAWANTGTLPTLALDAPSGLDLDTGVADPDTVRATATMTLGLPKPGLLSAPEVGELCLADISIPGRVYAEFGLVGVPVLFAEGPVLRLGGPDEPMDVAVAGAEGSAWRTWREATRLIVVGATFATAVRIALVVGTLLTVVHLGGLILGGRAYAATAARVAANYLVPYVVASLGVLSGTRKRA